MDPTGFLRWEDGPLRPARVALNREEGEGREKTIGLGGEPFVDGRVGEASWCDQLCTAPISFSALKYVLFVREWVGGEKNIPSFLRGGEGDLEGGGTIYIT